MNRWGQEMFCGHRRFAGTTKLSDKMCFWSTAGTKNISSGAARYAEFRAYEISLLLRSRAGFAKCWRLYPPEAAAPGGLANASRPHSQLCTRSPLPDPLIPAGPACTGQSLKTAQSAARGQLITTFYCHTYLPAL